MLSKLIQFVKPSRENLTGSAKEFSKRKFLSNFFYGVKKNQTDIILVIGAILISLLSFAIGYIMAKEQEKTSIKYENSYYRSRDLRTLSWLEALSKKT